VKAARPDRRPPATPAPQPAPSRLHSVVVLLPVAAGLLLLAGVVLLGWLALQALHGQPRYQIAFDDIECTPPPHLTREKFLEEVQFIAEFPDSACALDEGLPARLSAAFARHPWVEQVQGVEVAAPRQVRVRLVYRTAVLRVKGEDGESAVDRFGVRLPAAAADPALPLLVGDLAKPRDQGQPWGDDRVEAAARTAAFLAPYQDRLSLQIVEAAADGGLTLSVPAGRVRWGKAPGGEALGEPSAEDKVRRLLDFAATPGDGHGEIDLREAPR
jgi:hypothetical protein